MTLITAPRLARPESIMTRWTTKAIACIELVTLQICTAVLAIARGLRSASLVPYSDASKARPPTPFRITFRSLAAFGNFGFRCGSQPKSYWPSTRPMPIRMIESHVASGAECHPVRWIQSQFRCSAPRLYVSAVKSRLFPAVLALAISPREYRKSPGPFNFFPRRLWLKRNNICVAHFTYFNLYVGDEQYRHEKEVMLVWRGLHPELG